MKKKRSLNQIFSLSLSLSITLSPHALLNSIKEKQQCREKWRLGVKGEAERRKGEDGEGKDFNI